MYNINYKKYNFELIKGLILLLVGILFLSLYMNSIFNGSLRKLFLDNEIEAKKINENKKDKMYSPVYVFEVNDKTYYCEVKNASKVKPNKKHTLVYYDSDNPNNCVNEYEASPSIYSYIIIFFPMFSISLGLFAITLSLKDIRNLNYLEKHGTLIKNMVYTIDEIEIKKRKYIKVIKIEYKLENGEIINLISDLPKKDLEIIGYIDLLIDKNNLNNFYMNFNL